MKAASDSPDLDKQRINQWILELSELQLLEKVKYLMASHSSSDWWDEISDAEKNAIEEGISQIKVGQGISHQEVKEGYAKWLQGGLVTKGQI